jgi:hypothetical protein
MASLPLRDVVLADHTPATAESEPAVVDPTLPTIQLSYTAEDDAVLPPEVREPSAHDMADVAEPARTTLDEPRLQDMGLLPSFKDEWAPLTIESMPEDMLTSSDIFPLADLEEILPQEHLILELDASVLPADLASSCLEDATPMAPDDTPQLPETLTGVHLELPLLPADASTFADLGDITLPGHLTLELDRSDMASGISSTIPDRVPLAPPPGAMQSPMPPGEDHTKDEVELLLDLDNVECDDDKPA